MILGETIFKILSNTESITNIVGTSIFPVTLPQGERFPAIIYSEVSREVNDTKTGASTNDKINVQFDLYTTTYREAQNLANTLRDQLDRYTDDTITHCVMESQSDEGLIEEHRVYRVIQQYEFRL